MAILFLCIEAGPISLIPDDEAEKAQNQISKLVMGHFFLSVVSYNTAAPPQPQICAHCSASAPFRRFI